MAIEHGDVCHQPVMLAECLELLAVKPGGFYVDGTLGLGGHAAGVLARSAPDGWLLGTDRDAETLALARERLAAYADRCRLEHADYRTLPERLGSEQPDGILLDLGVSSPQLDDPARGFSLKHDGPLDMRMDRARDGSAADAVDTLSEEELADVIYRFGEERSSRRIAREIVTARLSAPIETTAQLAAIVRRAAVRGRRSRAPQRIDPATRTFQALRIHVNRELEGLGHCLRALAGCLAPGGRLVVISFHSLEDREVKLGFRELATRGFTLLTKKPLRPGAAELAANPRARSARLRALAVREAGDRAGERPSRRALRKAAA